MSAVVDTPAAPPTPQLPTEVVTHTPVQDVALPGGAGILALVTLDNGLDHTRPSASPASRSSSPWAQTCRVSRT